MLRDFAKAGLVFVFIVVMIGAFVCFGATKVEEDETVIVVGEESAVFGASLPNTFQSYVITQKNGLQWILIQDINSGRFEVIPRLHNDGTQYDIGLYDPQPDDVE